MHEAKVTVSGNGCLFLRLIKHYITWFMYVAIQRWRESTWNCRLSRRVRCFLYAEINRNQL